MVKETQLDRIENMLTQLISTLTTIEQTGILQDQVDLATRLKEYEKKPKGDKE